MLVLQQLFNLSDEELKFQVNDRCSFEDFVGLGVMNSIPDADPPSSTPQVFWQPLVLKPMVTAAVTQVHKS